jgi:hypothetical protein
MGNPKSAITTWMVLTRIVSQSSYGQLIPRVAVESKWVRTSFRRLKREIEEILINQIELFIVVSLSVLALRRVHNLSR